MAAHPENRSVGELLRDLAGDVTTLVRQEMLLARTEAQDTLQQTVLAVMALMSGILVAFAALVILLLALIDALVAAGLDRVWADLGVGSVVAVIAFILVRKGQHDLSAAELVPERTAANVRKDIRLVKEQVT